MCVEKLCVKLLMFTYKNCWQQFINQFIQKVIAQKCFNRNTLMDFFLQKSAKQQQRTKGIILKKKVIENGGVILFIVYQKMNALNWNPFISFGTIFKKKKSTVKCYLFERKKL